MREASPTAAREALLDVRDLSGGYGGTPVLRGTSLAVRPGEIVAVAGRNGAGKTTLMKTLMGLLPCTDGEILFAGARVERLPAFRRARLGIGYVPQGRELFPRMTVAENIVAGSLARMGGRPDFDRLFGCFPALADRRRQKAGTLSGGQQQQLAIARALACNPSLLLMDETAEGIQPNVVQEIARTLRRLTDGTVLGILLVEQNLTLIDTVADRVHTMEKGRVSPAAVSPSTTAAQLGLEMPIH